MTGKNDYHKGILDGFANGTVAMHDIFLREIEECKKSIAYLSKKR